MIEEIARMIFQGIYEAHSFCKANPDCYMPDKWEDLTKEVKQNYLSEALIIHQKYIDAGWVKLADNQELPKECQECAVYRSHTGGARELRTPKDGEVWKRVKK